MEERAIYVDIDPNDIHDAEPELLFDSHYRAKQIMLDYGTEPLIKAGSPISASGKVSNNASAIGILKRDCYRHLTSVGDVIIGGYIKSDIAQSHSGIAISDAARAAMSRLAFIGADGVPGGHPQSDWNQNDDTQPDYVKNRPFYTGDPVEMVLLEETTATFSVQGGIYQATIAVDFSLEFGTTYKVSWDGTVYECTSNDFNNLPFIGNQSILGIGSDTGEPFIAGTNNGTLSIVTQDTSASHTISISGSVAEIKKIDEKYLPKRFAASKKIFFNATNDELNDAVEHYKKGGLLYLSGRLVLDITGTLSTGGLSFYTNEGVHVFTSNGEHITYSSITKYPSNDYIPPTEFYLSSSTANSTKKFKITVDDSGAISATEVS